MKKIFFICALAICMSAQAEKLSIQQTYDIGKEVYVYAYPMVLMQVTEQVSTNVAHAIGGMHFRAPINQFASMSAFPNANFKDVVRPNADTLYSSAWLDLSQEPIVLSVPNTHGRYYLMPMLSAWTEVFASPGKRTTGTNAQNFLITGPLWHGKLPPKLTEIKSPTTMVWILGRTQTNGESDYNFVHDIQKGYKLTPLSKWNSNYTPPTKLSVDLTVDSSTAPVSQVTEMSAEKFLTVFAKTLKTNPPKAEDKAMVALIAKLGITPNKDFNIEQLDNDQRDALNRAAKAALKEIIENVPAMGARKQGWDLTSIIGTYGTHYLDRASIAYAGLGANLPADAIYPTAFVDGNNQPLDGKNEYVIHFDKGKLPPEKAFWSLSMYDKDSFFVANTINRYAIGDRDKLQFNQDGSLDIYIQRTAPDNKIVANWLPSPEGEFSVTLRIYWPKEEALDGKWNAPGLVQTSA